MKNKVEKTKKEKGAKSILRVPVINENDIAPVKGKKKLRPVEKLENDPKFRVALQKFIRKSYLINAITDPFSDEKMPAKAFGYTLTVNDTESDESMGAMLCEFMRDMSADELQKVFDAIIRMKRKAEFLHRNSFAYYAYSNYIEAYGVEPTKHALKTYILEHPRKYKDAPSPEDKSGWTRIWKAIGLETLKSK
jgi:hypothetical protein